MRQFSLSVIFFTFMVALVAILMLAGIHPLTAFMSAMMFTFVAYPRWAELKSHKRGSDMP